MVGRSEIKMIFTSLTSNVISVRNNGPHIIFSTQAIRTSTTINGIVTPNLIYQPYSIDSENKLQRNQKG